MGHHARFEVIGTGRLGHTLPTMWRMYILRRVLREYELLEVGLALLDGSFWTNPYWSEPQQAELSDLGLYPVRGDY